MTSGHVASVQIDNLSGLLQTHWWFSYAYCVTCSYIAMYEQMTKPGIITDQVVWTADTSEQTLMSVSSVSHQVI